MKPSIPKGTRDFNPEQVRKRTFIFDTLKAIFIRFGYQAIETPVMEKLSTLTGKYGEEGDRLLFKVLNNGDYLKNANAEALENKNSKKLTSSIAKRGLRYDLTVPFARFVVMNQNDLTFPFKRFQIQPVWRGDRPQKGRYQEFFQCDIDVVGSSSLINEVELVQMLDEGYSKLNINAQIRLNNRKILSGLAEIAGIKEQFMSMTIAIDKLDKIGMDGVRKELENREISSPAIETIIKVLGTKDLEILKGLMKDSETGLKGVEELEKVFSYLPDLNIKNEVVFDITLARGLNYYTGTIFEVAAKDVQIGSIGGGGRYDDLTGMFGLPNLPGVGVSFGIDRIFDVMEELDCFPDLSYSGTQLIFLAFDDASFDYAFKALQKARNAGINAEIYPAPLKFNKQIKYANNRGIPYVAIAGSQEMEANTFNLKDMKKGTQETLSLTQLINQLS